MADLQRQVEVLAARVAELERQIGGVPSRFTIGGGGGGGTGVGFYIVTAADASTITLRKVSLNASDQWEAAGTTVQGRAACGSIPLDYGGRLAFGPGTDVNNEKPMPFLGISVGGRIVPVLPLKPFGQRTVPDDADTSG